jgi:hypothetical protein
MRAFKVMLAFFAGAWLYHFAVVVVGGMLAAVAVPRGYFELFGRQDLPLALALVSLVTRALPVFVLVSAGCLASSRLLPGVDRAFPIAYVLGMLACCGFWLSVSEGGPVSIALIPWWGAPAILAPWGGAAWGLWLVSRSTAATKNAGV